ncbi:hypothetical protein PMAYCL1PPCAC_15733 [Pristionchus mayeri]|uniref:Membrane transporter n=1 Tax=Pristionchus mayeri TaxID=1317129 RepID=A0AAN5HYF6_9BILA|nr:hypothetical protein PMAYCL1PPCAC_15733 [Pristionchus mayeri]
MRESRYDLPCAALLGLGQLCMFMGYDTQLTIVEPVLHSVHDRSPESIDEHAGYYGLAFCYVTVTLANLVAPWALGILGSKYALLLGSTLFSVHIASFFFIHYIPYYLTSATLGIGCALFYTGHGAYATEHSTKATIERNSALTWALAMISMTLGGMVMLFTIEVSEENSEVDLLSKATSIDSSYRQYSESEIRLLYGAFLLVTLVSNIIFVLIPTRAVNNSIASLSYRKERIGFVIQMSKYWSATLE